MKFKFCGLFQTRNNNQVIVPLLGCVEKLQQVSTDNPLLNFHIIF